VGLQISRIYSVFNPWGKLAAEWLEIGDDLSKLQAFINSTLAQPFKQKAVTVDSDKLAEHIAATVKEKVVPDGYDVVISTADYHGRRFGVRFCTWAFNPLNYAMDMIEYGELGSLDDFGDRIASPYKNAAGGESAVDFAAIDSGWRAGEVYDFCRKTPRCMPTKGFAGRAAKPYSLRDIDEYENARGKKVKRPKKIDNSMFKLFLLDADLWKDQFYNLLNSKAADGGEMVRFHDETAGDFLESISAEKRVERKDRRGRITTEWVVDKVNKNHYWDASVMATAIGRWYIPQVVNARLRAMKKRPRVSKRGGGFLDNMPRI